MSALFRQSRMHQEFAKRKPWITKFTIDGKAYGGDYDAFNDVRVGQFFEHFPDVETILELGSLEGGHTLKLAKHPTVKRVLGLEGRQGNVDKSRFVQELFKLNNVEFVCANLETVDLQTFGHFDAIFCVGLLYHLPEPWKLIAQLSRVSKHVFIWTHYAAEERAHETVNGFKGLLYQEWGAKDPLSGMSSRSFWPTLPALRDMLASSGFTHVHIITKETEHPHGPCVTLAARLE
jgi:SAM-dependent methyltransferase